MQEQKWSVSDADYIWKAKEDKQYERAQIITKIFRNIIYGIIYMTILMIVLFLL